MPARRGARRGRRAPFDEGHAVDLFPAIDLRGGNAVRLLRGRLRGRDRVRRGSRSRSRAGSRPRARGGSTSSISTRRARVSRPTSPIVAAIAAAVACRVQVGGGVRSVDAARRAARRRRGRGSSSAPPRSSIPELVDELCRDASRPGRGRARRPGPARSRCGAGSRAAATDLVELGRRFAASGVAALIVTEIGRDGTLEGPDLDQLAHGAGRGRAPGGRQRRRRDARRSPGARPARGRRPAARRGDRRPGAVRGALHGGRGARGAAPVSECVSRSGTVVRR